MSYKRRKKSYETLEDLSFCDRERALLSVIIKTVLTFGVVKKKEKESFQYFCFLGIRKKKAEVKFKSRSRNRPRPGIQRSAISSLQSPPVESR